MKKIMTIVLAGLTLSACVSSAKKKGLPRTWRPVQMQFVDREACGLKHKGASGRVPVITADFDGDGRMDSATLVEKVELRDRKAVPLALAAMIVMADNKPRFVAKVDGAHPPYAFWIKHEPGGTAFPSTGSGDSLKLTHDSISIRRCGKNSLVLRWDPTTQGFEEIEVAE